MWMLPGRIAVRSGKQVNVHYWWGAGEGRGLQLAWPAPDTLGPGEFSPSNFDCRWAIVGHQIVVEESRLIKYMVAIRNDTPDRGLGDSRTFRLMGGGVV